MVGDMEPRLTTVKSATCVTDDLAESQTASCKGLSRMLLLSRSRWSKLLLLVLFSSCASAGGDSSGVSLLDGHGGTVSLVERGEGRSPHEMYLASVAENGTLVDVWCWLSKEDCVAIASACRKAWSASPRPHGEGIEILQEIGTAPSDYSPSGVRIRTVLLAPAPGQKPRPALNLQVLPHPEAVATPGLPEGPSFFLNEEALESLEAYATQYSR